jgi:putative transcriptional regulator
MNRAKKDGRTRYRTSLLASVHETAKGLHAGGVMDKRTMRKFDVMCLTPVRPLSARQIQRLRRRERASQAVFARYLNVTPGLVSQWERGVKRPRGASLKLLALVAQNGLDGRIGPKTVPPISVLTPRRPTLLSLLRLKFFSASAVMGMDSKLKI